MTKRDPQLNIRLPQELKDRLTVLAGKNKRSVNTEAVEAIKMAILLEEKSEPSQSSFMIAQTLKHILIDDDRLANSNQDSAYPHTDYRMQHINNFDIMIDRDDFLIKIIQATVAEVLRQQQKTQS